MVPRDQLALILGLHGVAETRLLKAHRQQARRRGLTFQLERDHFVALSYADCFYCGASPGKRIKILAEGFDFFFWFQGIDRVDNDRGYEPDNVVSCCGDCNIAKGTKSQADFVARARRIAERVR